MSTSDEEFLEELRATFKVEAAEHLQAIATGVLNLEKSPAPDAQRKLLESVFRAAHSLKGAARAVDFTEIESLCQTLEDRFAAWKRQEGGPNRGALDALHLTLNAITAAMSRSPAARSGPAGLATPVAAAVPAASVPPPPPAERTTVSAEGTVRIPVAKLDARLVAAEELLTAKLTTGQRAADLRDLARRFEAWRNEWTAVEPDARSLRQILDRRGAGTPDPQDDSRLARLLEFVDWNHDHLKSLEGSVTALTRTAQQDRHLVGKLVDDLLEDSKQLLLLPFATIAAAFPKLVRDLGRDQGKEADLVIRGDEIAVDKRILEEMKDPFIHLLRNSVDHGIESAEARQRLGKPARATITLAVSQLNDSKVEFVVADDGAGIDVAQVKSSAVKRNLVSAEEAQRLDDAAARELIFQAEVSTSPLITRVSGRGLGLAIVREKAEKLGGSVSLESQPGRGTSFRIILPSMLATFRGLLIEAEGRLLVIPTSQVERVARVRPGQLGTVEGRETISLDGRTVARVRLADVLQLPPAPRPGETASSLIAVILGTGDQRIAFTVDAVLDEQEVLVKRLGKPLSRVRNIAGATVLGSGQVAPILNVSDLLKSARLTGGAAAPVPAPGKPADAGAVLIAEDSITSRTLLKGILEAAGYRVKTAVDGAEAFTLLRSEKFDVVISDVEMPRLNGFDLTARIRADRKLAELPVVLVTALESREDRERGIDVGANAYIVKSSFDQSNLLDAVRRLI